MERHDYHGEVAHSPVERRDCPEGNVACETHFVHHDGAQTQGK